MKEKNKNLMLIQLTYQSTKQTQSTYKGYRVTRVTELQSYTVHTYNNRTVVTQ